MSERWRKASRCLRPRCLRPAKSQRVRGAVPGAPGRRGRSALLGLAVAPGGHGPSRPQAAHPVQVHRQGRCRVKAAELRELPDEELLARLESNKEELFNLRFQSVTGQLDNPMRIKQVRHDIARILGVLRSRQTEEELMAAVAAADRQSLEERREAIASGERKGRALGEIAEEQVIEQEAEAGAEGLPEGEEEEE